MRIFIDTSAFIALADRSDQFHSLAKGFVSKITGKNEIHTSSYIFDESITRLRFTAGYDTAIRFAGAFFANPFQKVHYVDREMEAMGYEKFRKYKDHSLSFTDCISLVILEREKIEQVFGFDEDFKRLGFALVP